MTNKEKFLYQFEKNNPENILSEYKLIEHIKNDKYKIKHLKCGTIFKKSYNSWIFKNSRCNNQKCINERREQTCLQRYGIKNGGGSKESIIKIKNSFKKRNISEEKKKAKETCLLKYGNENYNNGKKAKETCLLKYDNENYRGKSNKSKYFYYNDLKKLKNIKPLFSFSDYYGVRSGSKFINYKWKCNKCGFIFNDRLDDGIPICRKCNPILKGTSNIEKNIQNFIKSIIKSENNKRFYYKKRNYYELDIYVHERNMGIEINGLYWHSELSGGKNKNYHLNKTKWFNDKNINLLSFWDYECLYKEKIVKSIILNKLGLIQNKIYARKCEIKKVNTTNKNTFLENNHIQGKCQSSINIGLYYENKLVSLMCFSKSIRNKNYKWELVRFCSSLNTIVNGGFSKLLKYFKRNYQGDIISYADRRISNGHVYKKNKFVDIMTNPPSYYYIKRDKIYHKSNFKKNIIQKKFSNYNSELTEWENMQNNGYDRIWDCGKIVYVLQ